MSSYLGYAIVLVIGILIGRNVARIRDFERRFRNRESEPR